MRCIFKKYFWRENSNIFLCSKTLTFWVIFKWYYALLASQKVFSRSLKFFSLHKVSPIFFRNLRQRQTINALICYFKKSFLQFLNYESWWIRLIIVALQCDICKDKKNANSTDCRPGFITSALSSFRVHVFT